MTAPLTRRPPKDRVPTPSLWTSPLAACKDMDLEHFYPERSGAPPSPQALRACARCPVAVDCLETALEEEGTRVGRYGIRGGLTPKQRITLSRRRRENVRAAALREEQAAGEAAA